jgi:hypothetical protein
MMVHGLWSRARLLRGDLPQEEPVIAERLVERQQHETSLRRQDLTAAVPRQELALPTGAMFANPGSMRNPSSGVME